MVNPEIRDNVEEEDVPSSNNSSGVPHDRAHDQQAEIRQGNILPLERSEQRAGWVVVAGKLHLALALRTTLGTCSDIQEEIQLPSKQLVPNELDEGDDRSFFGEVLQLLDGDISLCRQLILCPGNENSILLHVAGITMVTSMSDLP